MHEIKQVHLVEFYDSDEALVRCVHEFMAPALLRGEPAIVVATPEHRQMISAALRESGIDLETAVREGRYVSVDAAGTLARFMNGPHPGSVAFFATVGELVRSTRDSFSNVHVYGEMVALLWKSGNSTASLELEELWNGLAKHQTFDLLCAYPSSLFAPSAGNRPFWSVCECHSDAHFIAAGSTTTAPGRGAAEADPLRCDIDALRRGIEQALYLSRLAEGVINVDTTGPHGFAYGLRSPHSHPAPYPGCSS